MSSSRTSTVLIDSARQDTPAVEKARRRLRIDWVALALLAAGAGLRLWLIVRGWPEFDGDEAIIGLMARHILYYGEHPIFFYGQPYMGALEAYLAAAFFAVIGPSVLAIRLATLSLILSFLICVYCLGKIAYGRAVGLLALAYLAFGPAFGVMRELPAIGGYQETLLFGALLPLLVYQRLRQPHKTPTQKAAWLVCIAQYALIGLVIGLGVWSDELILPFVAASLGALLLARPREVFGWSGVALLLGTLLGGEPFFLYNLVHKGQTFRFLANQQGSSPHGLMNRLHAALAQATGTFTIGVPTIFGSPHVCVQSGAVYGGYVSYPAMAVQQSDTPLCGGASFYFNLLLGVLILGIYALAAWSLVRSPVLRHWLHPVLARLRGEHHPSAITRSENTDSVHTAQLWLRAMLTFSALAVIAAYLSSWRDSGPDEFVSIRYLLPIYVTVPVLIGYVWDRLTALTKRIALPIASDAMPSSTQKPLAWLRGGGKGRLLFVRAFIYALVLLSLFALVAIGCSETITTASDSAVYAQPIKPFDARLIQEFRTLGITDFYGTYWVCYTIMFETNEQLHCSLYSNSRPDRYPPYATQLRQVAAPAYVLLAGSPEDATFQQTKAGQLYAEGYRHVLFEGYDIYYKPQ